MRKKDASENPHKGHRENVRRRYIVGGLEVFAPHEILELLLYYAIPQKDTNPIAHRLLDAYGSLARVISAPVSELQTIEGVGERTAILLSLTFQINRSIRLDALQSRGVNCDFPETVGEYLKELFSGAERETVYELCFNRRGDLVMKHCMANGSIASVSTDISSLIKNALLNRAERVVIAHNHPGGDAQPSQDDYAATRRIQSAFSAVHIRLEDHIIVSDGDCFSFRQSGFLKDL